MFNRLFGGGQSKTVAPVSAKTSENVVGAIQTLAEVSISTLFIPFYILLTPPEIGNIAFNLMLNLTCALVVLKPAARGVA